MNIRQQWKKIFFKKLIHYSTTLTLINASDTSLYGILAALSHRYLDISERPITNASRPLSSDEKKIYMQIEKESTGIISLELG